MCAVEATPTVPPAAPTPGPPTTKAGVVALGTVCLLFLIQLYGLIFFGTSEYFSFTDLAIASIHDVHWAGAIVRLLLPLIVGFVIARFSKGVPQREATWAGFYAAFLLTWPGVYFPTLRQDLVGETLANQPGKLLAIYVLFMASYALLGRAGALLGLAYPQLKEKTDFKSLLKKINMKDLIWTIVTGLLTNVIWEVAVRISH